MFEENLCILKFFWGNIAVLTFYWIVYYGTQWLFGQ